MYVSNVIDQLTAELDGQVADVTDHLNWALRVSRQAENWVPHFEFHAESLGPRPASLSVPGFPEKPFLAFGQRLVWPFYGEKKRATLLSTNTRYQTAFTEFRSKWQAAIDVREAEIAQYDRTLDSSQGDAARQNELVSQLQRNAADGDPEAQWQLFELRLQYVMRSLHPLSGEHRATYSSDSHRVVIEFEAPTRSVVPAAKSVRFYKTTGEHRYSPRSETDIRRMYAAFVAQAVLGVLHAAVRISPASLVETIGVNAVVHAPDPATGLMGDVPIVSVVSGRDVIESIHFDQVDPVTCLRSLSAVVSRSPAEVAPIRPIVRLDTSDPRFIADSDVLSELDQRPNLMELTPNEFEALVQNLFSKMGLDTKQTRPSRDGGVDAIAYDPRPVLGGKIVIQAKRYKGTVGVSAVRDLFGTLQNEGGSKGILVTTSGYGSASFDFAKNKPLELIDGGNLLFLLKEHTGVDARIVMPEDWVDPRPDN